MMYIKTVNMDFTDPDIQYDDVDFTSRDYVEAEYIKVEGFPNNPDIAALPRPYIGSEALNRGVYIPDALLNPETDPMLRIYSLRSLRLPMLNQGEINSAIYNCLVNSYSGRDLALTEHKVRVQNPRADEGKELEINLFSTAYMNQNTFGAAVIGSPGTGKTTAVSIALAQYPRAIVHNNLEKGYYYTQIPIIRTTAFANSNLNALFTAFATVLDNILDMGNVHRQQVQSGTLGKLSAKIVEWIKLYHIGLWIIEEISFFHFTAEKSNSFENIVTIMAETGVSIFVTGNEDIYTKLKFNLRQERRLLANAIRMNDVTKEKKYMKLTIKKMWSYMLPELQGACSDEACEIIFTATLGSIDMISLLLIIIQKEYYISSRKGIKVQFTPKYIQQISDREIGSMRALFEASNDFYYEERKKMDNMIGIGIEMSKKTIEIQKLEDAMEAGYDHCESLMAVQTAIEITDINHFYTKKQMESAFAWCEKNIHTFIKLSRTEMIRAVLRRLEDVRQKKNTLKKKQMEDNYQALKENLLGV